MNQKTTIDPETGVTTVSVIGFCEHCPNWGKCPTCQTTNYQTQVEYLQARISVYGPQE